MAEGQGITARFTVLGDYNNTGIYFVLRAGTPPPTVPTTVTDPDRSRHIVTGNATYNYTSDKGDEIGRRIQEKHGSVIPSTGEPHSAIVTG